MNKALLMTIGLNSLLLAEMETSIAINTDVGVGSYNLDIQGSDYVRAIAYDVAEVTVGVFENIGSSWQYGVSYRGVLKEVSTNAYVPRTGGKDSANIDRSEWLVEVHYIFDIENIVNNLVPYQDTDIGEERLSLNMMYYNSSLDASNQFELGSTFNQHYKYDTQGAKVSLHYNLLPNNDDYNFWLTGGLVYTDANLDFEEHKDGNLQPYYVKSSVNALGYNFGAGMSYDINNQTRVKSIVDWYNVDFGDINVVSRTQGLLGKASFEENTASVRIGVAYKFD